MSALRYALLGLLLTSCGRQKAVESNPTTAAVSSTEVGKTLLAGDVLLVPLNCYVCNAIESEIGLPYSHSVVVANTTTDASKRYVFEAWGTVKKTPYLEILGRKQKNQKLFHLRAAEFAASKRPGQKEISSIFEREFGGLPFDDEYLWTNTDEQGRDKLYCSEFVIKFMNRLSTKKLNPSPMDFSRNLPFWKKYYEQFGMLPPTGQPGGSPASIYFSDLYLRLGEIEEN